MAHQFCPTCGSTELVFTGTVELVCPRCGDAFALSRVSCPWCGLVNPRAEQLRHEQVRQMSAARAEQDRQLLLAAAAIAVLIVIAMLVALIVVL